MLTENTGRHFLDSGGAYGRNWERAQGMTVESFLALPPVTVHRDYVTLDVFHYLRSRLEYDRAETARFVRWANTGERADDNWLTNMEEWAKLRHVSSGGYSDDHWSPSGGFNSYNSDNMLSQEIQGDTWTAKDGRPFVLLQIHGGCDVRGGYTAPRAFTVTTDEAYQLFDWCQFTVVCREMGSEGQVIDARKAAGPMLPGMPVVPVWEDVHVWDCLNSSDWVEFGGSFTGDPWKESGKEWIQEHDGQHAVMCPRCESPCDVYEYPS
jgi:hypothetical protein